MKVTVLIPTRNRALLLREALQSALGQSLAPHEVIVVDDGSDDDTAAVIASFGSALRAVSQPRGGKSRALNHGYSLATGDAVIVLDDDDILAPYALERHVAALVQSPEADFSYGRFLRFRGEPPAHAVNRSDPRIDHLPIQDARRTVVKLMEYCFLPNPAWMARRSALDIAGPYDELLHRNQDFDMILRLARDNEGAFVDDVVLYQRQHDGARPGVAASGRADVASAWRLYDQSIFEEIARTWRTEDFRPFVQPPFPAHAERAAWLQKGVILFTRKCYPEALDALMTYRRLIADDCPDPVEIAIASHMLMREVGAELLTNDASAKLVRRGLRSAHWCLALRRTFVGSARWHVRAALNGGDIHLAMRLAYFLIDAFGLIGTSIGMMHKTGTIDRLSFFRGFG